MKRHKIPIMSRLLESNGREKFSRDVYVWKERTEPLTNRQIRDSAGIGLGARELDTVGDAGVTGNWWSRQRERWYK